MTDVSGLRPPCHSPGQHRTRQPQRAAHPQSHQAERVPHLDSRLSSRRSPPPSAAASAARCPSARCTPSRSCRSVEGRTEAGASLALCSRPGTPSPLQVGHAVLHCHWPLRPHLSGSHHLRQNTHPQLPGLRFDQREKHPEANPPADGTLLS